VETALAGGGGRHEADRARALRCPPPSIVFSACHRHPRAWRESFALESPGRLADFAEVEEAGQGRFCVRQQQVGFVAWALSQGAG
jgi:hypothetical protein